MEALTRNWVQAKDTSCFTVMVGRRRIGKTALILESLKKQRGLYLFVSRQTEPLLCAQFQREAEKALGVRIFGVISRFRDIFEQLLIFAEKEPYTLVIDEFQELERVNPSIFSEIQNLWDQYKDRVKINFIAAGSIYSMMMKIFEHSKEPLFGRLTARITLRPFRLSVMKNILRDYNPNYTAEDLLCFYMISGGVPKYIELLMDSGAVTAGKMLDAVTLPDSPFLNEGKELLVGEFGREYGTYFSILQLIAQGKNTQSEIDSIVGKNTGTYLANLEKEYSLITRVKPLFSKPESRNGRWKIADQYLRFWFRFIHPNQSLIETGQLDTLLRVIKKNYETYSGFVLEDYFREKILETNRSLETSKSLETGGSPETDRSLEQAAYQPQGSVTAVGSYWDKRGENEIDLIALNDLDRTAVVAEIKRKAKKINLSVLVAKAEKLEKELAGYQVEYKGWSMDDM
ncbi:ATPase [Spirochaetia bacterium]|nr:ATPase [Spirochaetia bacterium]